MKKLLGLSAIGLLAVALPAWAHHSHNAYEVTKWTEMEGTVTEIHYLLPHSWVYIEVKDAKGAEPAIWALEATVPKNAPASNWFQISVRFLDENYKPVRYQYSGLMEYSNGYPKPPLANQNQGAQPQAAQGR